MLVDCDGCKMRDVACMECSVGVLLGLSRIERPAASGDESADGADIGRDTGRETGADQSNERGAEGTLDIGSDMAGTGAGVVAVDADLVVEQWPGRKPFEWDATERRAIRALIDGGLIPPIRPAASVKSVTTSEILIAERGRLAG